MEPKVHTPGIVKWVAQVKTLQSGERGVPRDVVSTRWMFVQMMLKGGLDGFDLIQRGDFCE